MTVNGPFGELESTSSACRFQLLYQTDRLFFTGDGLETVINIEIVMDGVEGYIFLHCRQPSVSVQNWHSLGMRLLQKHARSFGTLPAVGRCHN